MRRMLRHVRLCAMACLEYDQAAVQLAHGVCTQATDSSKMPLLTFMLLQHGTKLSKLSIHKSSDLETFTMERKLSMG